MQIVSTKYRIDTSGVVLTLFLHMGTLLSSRDELGEGIVEQLAKLDQHQHGSFPQIQKELDSSFEELRRAMTGMNHPGIAICGSFECGFLCAFCSSQSQTCSSPECDLRVCVKCIGRSMPEVPS
jgi:hypothetical protein